MADAGTRQDDDVDAAVLGAAFGGVIGRDGVKLGVAGSREAIGCEAVGDEDAGEPGSASGRELPVGVELLGVNRNVVGVAFNANVVGRAGESAGDLVQDGQGARVNYGRAAIVEAGFAQGDDQSVAANLHR